MHDQFKLAYVYLKMGGGFPVEKIGKSINDSANGECQMVILPTYTR